MSTIKRSRNHSWLRLACRAVFREHKLLGTALVNAIPLGYKTLKYKNLRQKVRCNLNLRNIIQLLRKRILYTRFK